MKLNYNDVFVASQMPEHQATNNPLFVTLMQYYFKFLGQSKETFSIAKNLRENRTIDNTLDDFLSFFGSEFISKLPSNVAANKRQLMRRAIDLYQTKGTKKSVEAFFRLVYDQDAIVTFPRDQMFISSGSRWVQESSFRLNIMIGSIAYFDAVETLRWSNSSGVFSVKINRAQTVSGTIVECFFKRSSNFVLNPGDILTGFDSLGNISFRATAVVTTNKISILSSGKNFKVGQIFHITGTISNSLFRVIDIGPKGELMRVQFLGYGYGMADSDTIVINPYTSAPITDSIDISVTGSVTTVKITDSIAMSDTGVLTEPIPHGTLSSYFMSDYLEDSSSGLYFGLGAGSFNYHPSNPTNIRTKTNVSPAEYAASTATIRTFASTINTYPGQYEAIQGHISEPTIRLQDSYFYQIYSYLINSQIPLGDYKKSFGDLMHPAGKIFFGNLNLDSDIDFSGALKLYLAEIYSLDIKDGLSVSDDVANTVTLNKNDSQSFNDNPFNQYNVSVEDYQISTDTIGKYYSTSFSDSQGSFDSYSNTPLKNIFDPVPVTDVKTAQNTYVASNYFTSNDYVLTPAEEDVTKILSAFVADYYFDNVSLSLHMEGTNGSSSFLDSSHNGLAVNAVNATISSAKNKFGFTALYLSGGSTSHLYIADSPALDLSVGDFTVEAWVNVDVLGNYAIAQKDQTYGSTSSSWGLFLNTDGSIFGTVGSGNSNAYNQIFSSPAGLISANQWYHVAMVRANKTLLLFLNGVQVYSGTQNGNPTNGSGLTEIGRSYHAGGDNDWLFKGFIDDLRITKGYARYQTNFNVPTLANPDYSGPNQDSSLSSVSVAFDMVTSSLGSGGDPYYSFVTALMDMESATSGDTVIHDTMGNTFNCENGVAVTNAMTHFGLPTIAMTGAGNGRITINPASALDLSGVTSSTVEGWIYPTALRNNLFSSATNTGGMGGFFVTSNSSGQVCLYMREYYCIPFGPVGAIVLNTWNHIAVSFVGTTAYLFANGVLQGTGTIGSTYPALDGSDFASVIGTVYNDITLSGYMGQFRITKGVARYTTSFTPPTNAFPTFTTTAMVCFDKYGNQLVPSGTSAFDSTVRHFSLPTFHVDGSAGSGSRVYPSSAFNMAYPQATLEMWFYPTSFPTSNEKPIFSSATNTGSIAGFHLMIAPSGALSLYAREYYVVNATSAILNLGQWNHIAMVITNSNTATIYLNGIAVGSGTIGTQGLQNSDFAALGNNVYDTGSSPGYYGQVRITPNVARYTSNFTVPNLTFPTRTGQNDFRYNANLGLMGAISV